MFALQIPSSWKDTFHTNNSHLQLRHYLDRTNSVGRAHVYRTGCRWFDSRRSRTSELLSESKHNWEMKVPQTLLWNGYAFPNDDHAKWCSLSGQRKNQSVLNEFRAKYIDTQSAFFKASACILRQVFVSVTQQNFRCLMFLRNQVQLSVSVSPMKWALHVFTVKTFTAFGLSSRGLVAGVGLLTKSGRTEY